MSELIKVSLKHGVSCSREFFFFFPNVSCAFWFKRSWEPSFNQKIVGTLFQSKDRENPISIKRLCKPFFQPKLVRALCQSKDRCSEFFQEPSLNERSVFWFFQEPSCILWRSRVFTRIFRRSCGISFVSPTYLSTSLKEWGFHLRCSGWFLSTVFTIVSGSFTYSANSGLLLTMLIALFLIGLIYVGLCFHLMVVPKDCFPHLWFN